MINIESETIIKASTSAIYILKEWFDDARFNHQESVLHIMISIKLMDKIVLRHNKSACKEGEILASMNQIAEEASEAIFNKIKSNIDIVFENKYNIKE